MPALKAIRRKVRRLCETLVENLDVNRRFARVLDQAAVTGSTVSWPHPLTPSLFGALLGILFPAWSPAERIHSTSGALAVLVLDLGRWRYQLVPLVGVQAESAVLAVAAVASLFHVLPQSGHFIGLVGV